ncbi:MULTISPECIES: hypothetical protein [unclassified Shewanella]|uniref:hypothetical protein n=1 Tax=unclassified Shewanella TaxID=196818 RepID=UPI000CACBBE6|nr:MULTISPECIES: hypothetical protein [unclassified Shewanella]MBB1390090.1 hypothetical protein [Shewanella sp. SG44-6]PIX69773.1 MAG: hypothetical protein COZ42_17465 [Shewanella sp. CG_4_10_14_3_um_filter_42_91]PIY64919.1 MAG: hypothetical protein COY92_14655 [Shewanella sp. CG_4_10_14_0_8_um_filter_42_13]
MNTTTQPARQNSLVFTGNVSQVKPIQGGACAISLAYNEGSMVNGQWETKDTLFLEAYIPAKLNFQPNVGDKMTISGFMAANNYQPQNSKKRYGSKVVINEIVEYIAKTVNNASQQNNYNNPPQQHAPQYAPRNAPQRHAPRNAPQQHAPQYAQRNAPQQHAPQYAPQQHDSRPNNSFQRGAGFQN